MSAKFGNLEMRRRIAASLQSVLDEESHSSLARLLCLGAPSTVSRRGSDLHQWPASHLLDLAWAYPQILDAIVEYLLNQSGERNGSAAAAYGSLVDHMREAAELVAAAATAIEDGRVDRCEAKALRARLRAITNHIKTLDAHLGAIEGES